MYVVERTQYYCEGDGKETLIAETKEKLIQELEGCFIDWYEPSEYSPEDYPDIDRIGIKAVKDDDWEEGDWYDWEFDEDYLSSLEGDKIVEFFNNLSTDENFTLLYERKDIVVVPLYSYEDEDTGEKVYDFESILDEVRKLFTEATGKVWEGE